ncbi:MAG: pitrilysin family protein [Verrucomicrobiota bacterium]
MSDYRLTTLPNGIRIASVEMPHMQSASVGIWTGVGARFEPKALSGISHFIEHLMFKGTQTRNAKQITESVEGIGGYLNAFTTEDHTCYYAKAGARHLRVLGEVLVDMVLNSQFAPEEIEREREVIREEIMMYRDQPAQHVQEMLSETMWPDHPLGRPLTGTVDSISTFKRSHFLDFVRKNYNGRSLIVTVAGRAAHEEVVALFQPLLARVKPGVAPRFARARALGGRKVSLVTQDTEQTHLAMGYYSFGRTDERRFALKLLSVILGENMSSRLFQKLREQHGYCYSVQTGMVTLADSGLINIAAGLDPSKLQKAMRAIFEELEKIRRKKPGQQEVRRAQDYTIGQTLMGLESTSNQMMWMGESILGYRKILDPVEIEKQMMAVTPEAIQEVAGYCLDPKKLGVAVIGPLKDQKQIESWIE